MLRFNWEKILGIYPKARFQYILCYGSTRFPLMIYKSFHISIHPMLRFNDSTKVNTPLHRQISIHPMLRFNFWIDSNKQLWNHISIHPMLRFNQV